MEEGLPDWWGIGQDFPRNFRKSRTNRWELTVPTSGAWSRLRIAYFRTHFQPDIGSAKKGQNEAFLAAIRPIKRVARIVGGAGAIPPRSPVNRGPIIRALFLAPNRG